MKNDIKQLKELEEKKIEDIQKEIQEKKQKAINTVLEKYLSNEEIEEYNTVSKSMGIVVGLLIMLEENKILETLGTEISKDIENSFDLLISYTGKELENRIGQEKSERIRQELIKEKII